MGLGDELTFLGSGRDGSFAAAVATVVGILDTGLEEVDRSMAQVPLAWFQQVFAMGDARPQRGDQGAVPGAGRGDRGAAARHAGAVGRNWRYWTGRCLVPGLRQAITSDMASAWFTYSVLVVLVAFSVLNTQLMSVLERTREFGVMLALGMSPRPAGAAGGNGDPVDGGTGPGTGARGGVVLTLYLSHAGFTYPGVEEMMAKFMLSGRIYPQVSVVSLLAGPLAVLVGAMLAALYPALRLFRLQPVAAMRAV